MDTKDCLDSVEKVEIITPSLGIEHRFLGSRFVSFISGILLTGDWWIPEIIWILILKVNKMQTGNITAMTNTICCVYSIKIPDDGQ